MSRRTWNFASNIDQTLILSAGLLWRILEMPCGGRGRSPGSAEEPPAEPRHAAVGAGVGDGAVVGRAAGRRRAHRLHGRLRQVLRCTHALLQP